MTNENPWAHIVASCVSSLAYAAPEAVELHVTRAVSAAWEAGRAAEREATDELREALREISHVEFRTTADMQAFARAALARSVSPAPDQEPDA